MAVFLKKKFWLSPAYWLILGSIVGAAYLSVNFFQSFLNYYKRSEQVILPVVSWQVKVLNNGQCLAEAGYTLDWQGQHCDNKIFWPRKFLNYYAAQGFIMENGNRKWRLWFDPKNPLNAALENVFPLKKLLYAFCAWAISLYFIFLQSYCSNSFYRKGD